MKVSRADTLADDIPLIATRHKLHFLLVHDFLKLLPYFSHLKMKRSEVTHLATLKKVKEYPLKQHQTKTRSQVTHTTTSNKIRSQVTYLETSDR